MCRNRTARLQPGIQTVEFGSLGLYRFKVASAKSGILLAERMTRSSCLSPIIEAIERRLSMNRQLDGWKAV